MIIQLTKIKKVKINRFKCFLYGRLISLLLTAGIVFTIKKDVINTTGDEISEMKSFSIVHEFFYKLRTTLFKRKLISLDLLNRIMSSIIIYGLKSRRKNRKTPFVILQNTLVKEIGTRRITWNKDSRFYLGLLKNIHNMNLR